MRSAGARRKVVIDLSRCRSLGGMHRSCLRLVGLLNELAEKSKKIACRLTPAFPSAVTDR